MRVLALDLKLRIKHFVTAALCITILLSGPSAVSADLCASAFFSFSTHTTRLPDVNSDSLTRLAAYIAASPFKEKSHALQISHGLGYVTIGYLTRSDRQFSKLLYRAVESGQIAEIRAGTIVGPKVLALLTGLKRVAKSNKPLQVTGVLPVHFIEEEFFEQTLDVFEHRNCGIRSPCSWTSKDIDDYHNAWRVLGVAEAVKTLNLRPPSIIMKFEMDARFPERVKWSVAADEDI